MLAAAVFVGAGAALVEVSDYTSLKNALTNESDGAILTANIIGGGSLISINGVKTLDLNGHVIDTQGQKIFSIDSGKCLTIDDSNPTVEHSGYSDQYGAWHYDSPTGEYTIPHNLTGGIITSTSDIDSHVIKVNKNGELIIRNGSIAGIKKSIGSYGPIMEINEGTFTMSGGAIYGNKWTGSSWGGTLSFKNAQATISGGEISNNVLISTGGGEKDGCGPAIRVDGDAAGGVNNIITITGGKIRNNKLLNSDGEPSNNGGAILIWAGQGTSSNYQQVIISGPVEISGNSAKYGGAIGVVTKDDYTGFLNLTITASDVGSPVIKDNYASQNGGFFSVNTSKGKSNVIIDGALIYNNTAGNQGGAIYLPKGTINLYGDTEITENKAATGGGIYLADSGEFIIGGKAKVAGNTNSAGTKLSNFYLPEGSYMKLNGASPLQSGADVGVTSGASSYPVKITTNYVADTYKYIKSDNPAYHTQNNGTSYIELASGTKYTVTYVPNGADSGTVPVDYTQYDSGSSVTVADNTGSLVKSGYQFTGWNNGVTTYQPGNSFSITENTILKANWTPTYTITNQSSPADFGSTTVNKTTAISGDSVKAEAVPNPGYHFLNWTNVNLTTPVYDNPFIFTMPDKNVSVTAHFAANITTLHFNPANATPPTPYDGQITYGTNKTNLSDDNMKPTRLGFNFTGWYLTEKKTIRIFNENAILLKNVKNGSTPYTDGSGNWSYVLTDDVNLTARYAINLSGTGFEHAESYENDDGSFIIKLTGDETGSISIPNYWGNVTLDLNGHNIKTTETDSSGNGKPGLILTDKGGSGTNLTLSNSAGTGGTISGADGKDATSTTAAGNGGDGISIGNDKFNLIINTNVIIKGGKGGNGYDTEGYRDAGSGGAGINGTNPTSITVNGATISGGNGGDGASNATTGDGGNGGNGGAGVGVTITNLISGTVTGGNGGNGGTSQDGNGGDGGAGGDGANDIENFKGGNSQGGNGGNGGAAAGSGNGGAGGNGGNGAKNITTLDGGTTTGGNGGAGGASQNGTGGDGGEGGDGAETITTFNDGKSQGGNGGNGGASQNGTGGDGGEGGDGAEIITTFNGGTTTGGNGGNGGDTNSGTAGTGGAGGDGAENVVSAPSPNSGTSKGGTGGNGGTSTGTGKGGDGGTGGNSTSTVTNPPLPATFTETPGDGGNGGNSDTGTPGLGGAGGTNYDETKHGKNGNNGINPQHPQPQPVPTYRPSSGGTTNTGAGHYTQYYRPVSNTDHISFDTSQVVSSVDLSNPTTGTVTVYYDTDATYKNNQNYDAEFAVKTAADGTEAVVIKTAGIKGAPVLVSNGNGDKSFYETFRIESDLKDGKVTEINFKVAKSGLLSNGVTKNDVILYHGLVDAKNNGEWIPLDTYLTGEDNVYVYYKAHTDGTSPFAVVFMEDMTITDEVSVNPTTDATSVPVTQPTVVVAAEKTVVTVQTAEPTAKATEAPKTPFGIAGLIAGLGAACVLVLRRRE